MVSIWNARNNLWRTNGEQCQSKTSSFNSKTENILSLSVGFLFYQKIQILIDRLIDF